MSQLSNNLKKDEQMISEGKVHWAILIIPGIFTLFYGIGLFWLVPRIVRILTTELSLSNKRLVGKYGLINTKAMDSPLNKINSVSVESGLFGKIFGYGRINVNTASTTYIFKYVRNATNFKNIISNEIDNYEDSRIEQQARSMAAAMQNA